MKKNKRNLILIILITSIIGTALVKLAEHMFGAANVFMFAVAVVAVVGLVVVPVMQAKAKYTN